MLRDVAPLRNVLAEATPGVAIEAGLDVDDPELI